MRCCVILLLAFLGVCFAGELQDEGNLEVVEYYAQFDQDKVMNEYIFKGKRDGVFIEIGAANGVTFSNSYFFEKNMGWSGICVEPVPTAYKDLMEVRNCHCLNAAIYDRKGTVDFCWVEALSVLPDSNEQRGTVHMAQFSGIFSEYDPSHIDRIEENLKKFDWRKNIITINCYTFNDLMEIFNLTKVDFVTIDTEGGEDKILRAIDFDKYIVDVFYVECNYDDKISEFMDSKGYVLVEKIECDLLFIRKEFYDTLEIETDLLGEEELEENC